MTNKIRVKDKSKIIVKKDAFGNDVKIAPGIYQTATHDGSYITHTPYCEVIWNPSKNPIKRFLGWNDIKQLRLKDRDRTYYYKGEKYYTKVTHDSSQVESSQPGWRYETKYTTNYSYTKLIPLKARYYARPLP